MDRNLIDMMSASHALLEIAVCDNDNDILLDSDPLSRERLSALSEFGPMVDDTNWLDKVKILNERIYYQLQQPLGSTPGKPELYVRVVIWPALIKEKDIVAHAEQERRGGAGVGGRRALHHAAVFVDRLPAARPPGTPARPGGQG